MGLVGMEGIFCYTIQVLALRLHQHRDTADNDQSNTYTTAHSQKYTEKGASGCERHGGAEHKSFLKLRLNALA